MITAPRCRVLRLPSSLMWQKVDCGGAREKVVLRGSHTQRTATDLSWPQSNCLLLIFASAAFNGSRREP